jgi:hypothetical protein
MIVLHAKLINLQVEYFKGRQVVKSGEVFFIKFKELQFEKVQLIFLNQVKIKLGLPRILESCRHL